MDRAHEHKNNNFQILYEKWNLHMFTLRARIILARQDQSDKCTYQENILNVSQRC
jgi:hypothetical protein